MGHFLLIAITKYEIIINGGHFHYYDNTHSVTAVVSGVVVASVGATVVTVSQPVSSSGQSFTPLHHKVSLMQIPLVGHKMVPSSQGLQMHSHVLVTTLLNP